MKIQKHGKKYKQESNIETFKCDNCGCEFTVKQDEYYTDKNINSGTAGITQTVSYYTISSKITDRLICSCPECHKIVSKITERDNICWSAPDITLNCNTTSANALDTTTQVTGVNPEIIAKTPGTTAK